VTHIRIHETIHGRAYVIEVVPVSRDRWRAQIARRGATTALMPFYGATPDEAARQLSLWLTRAGRGAASADQATSAPRASTAGRIGSKAG
jgi:hypothetical protein